MRARYPILVTAALLAGTVHAQDGKIVSSTIVLTSGDVSGVGGGKQPKFSVFDVCQANRMDDTAIEIATAKALDSLGLSLDPPSTDILSAIKVGNEWKTSPSNLQTQSVEEYNAGTELKLNKHYRYFVTYYGRVILKGSSLIVQTMTSLRMGNSSQESQPYSGDFDPNYFHIRLQSEILKDLKSNGCA